MSKINKFMLGKIAAIQSFEGKDEEGQGLAEYGLILALVAVLCAAALTTLQGGISGVLSSVAGKL